MLTPCVFDPAFHQKFELPITRYLRRELGLKNLLTYRHVLHGTWVVALAEIDVWKGGRMLEIGMLGTGEGEGSWCSAANARHIIHRIKSAIPKAEAKTRLRRHDRAVMQRAQLGQDRREESLRRVYRNHHKKYGALAAERWAQAVGVTACKPELRHK